MTGKMPAFICFGSPGPVAESAEHPLTAVVNTVIIHNPRCPWSRYENGTVRVLCAGAFWWGDDLFGGAEAARKLAALFAEELREKDPARRLQRLEENIQGFSGQFAFICDTPAAVVAAVDRVRSWPVFYARQKDTFFAADAAPDLAAQIDDRTLDPAALLEIQMAGYATSSSTLRRSIKQLQAGEWICLDKVRGVLSTKRYFRYLPRQTAGADMEILLEQHHRALDQTFKKLLASLNGAPVWIPLSGGLDSRLILGKLTDLKYDDIQTFTYGIPQLWEVKTAEAVARAAGVRWHFIAYDPKTTRKLFHTPDRRNYYRFAGGLCAVPFINEYHALKSLAESRHMSPDAVIINGQSGDFLTGGHLPAELLDPSTQHIDLDGLSELIIRKHFSLWADLKTPENLAVIRPRIKASVEGVVGDIRTRDSAAAAYEYHEWQERQSKYVVNGQRIYDWFGYQWRLPLWSDELMEFWRDVPWRVKIRQNLYTAYLKRYNPGGLFGIHVGANRSYLPIWLKIPSYAYMKLAKVLRADQDFFNRMFTKYHGAYAPYYPQTSYLAYLKDSRLHRNSVSYFSRQFLKEVSQVE